MGNEPRGESIADKEARIRDELLTDLTASPSVQLAFTATNQDHPALIMSIVDEGLFMLTVTRISTAVAQKVVGND